MPLEVGARLGPYEITGKLGAGGMGEVWKACDTRLDRTVAIKTSTEAFNARFEREARAVAALNHPNICQLFDIGPDYLVLEYVEGQPIGATEGVRKLLDLAVQIADGMAAAHAAGFVHRDLKPSNVLVTRDGRVKILDFGLAKNVEPQAGAAAPTITGTGLVAGTAAYMSPEQIRGSADLDARSDQFAFGLVLYEIATGKRPFERASGVETLMAIVRDEAEPLPVRVPAPLRWIIERCLAKEPEQRYASSRDLFLELRGLRDHIADASTTHEQLGPIAAPRRQRSWAVAAAFGVGALLTVGVAALLGVRGPTREADLRFTPLSFEPGGQNFPLWSPDGRAVAFAARQKLGEPYQLYVRNLDSPVAAPITRMAQVGDTAEWISTGRIVFASPKSPVGLWAVSSVGGEPESFLPLNEATDAYAAVSRDGTAVAIVRRGEDRTFGVWVSSPPGAPAQRYEPAPFATPLVFNTPVLHFSPDGRELLLMWTTPAQGAESWLMPYPADPARPPRRVLHHFDSTVGTPQFSWMPDSRHVVVAASPAATMPDQLYVANVLSGEVRTLSRGTTRQFKPAVSPDGDKVAFIEGTNDFDVVTLDLSSAAVAPLIATSRSEEMPAWAPGPASLVYVTDRNGAPEIWLHKDGETEHQIVTARDFPSSPTQWFMGPELSPDADRVIYLRIEQATGAATQTGGARLWMSAVAGGAPVRLVSGDSDPPFTGTWSPDGSWYVYWTAGPGGFDLRKVRTTGQAESEILRTGLRRAGNWVPVWSPAGDWILYDGGGLKLTSVDGKNGRDLGENALCTFARDGQRLFCLRDPPADGSRALISMNLEGAAERLIGTVPAEQVPRNSLGPALRLTLTPDGKSVTYSIVKPSLNLWLIEGLATVPSP